MNMRQLALNTENESFQVFAHAANGKVFSSGVSGIEGENEYPHKNRPDFLGVGKPTNALMSASGTSFLLYIDRISVSEV